MCRRTRSRFSDITALCLESRSLPSRGGEGCSGGALRTGTSGSRARPTTLEFQSVEEFLSEDFVGGSAGAVFVVIDDGLPEAWRLGEPGGARNHRFKDQIAEMLPDFGHDLVR